MLPANQTSLQKLIVSSFLTTFLILGSYLLTPNTSFGEQFTCPMHPHYISDTAGTCPICGMDLVKLESEAETNDQVDVIENQRTAITIAPETIQNIGVRMEPAEQAYFGKNIRSFGLVSENTRLTHEITGRVAGWIETLAITAVGDKVEKGDVLFTLYSPNLISAQQDYLAALATKNRGRIESSAQRLTSMGVAEQVLKTLQKTRKKMDQVPFYATNPGVVHHLQISQGSYIKPGSHIANIQNYQSVWVNVSVAAKDLPYIQKDTKATVKFPNLGNTERPAQVDYIYPTIEESSRTGKIRLVLDNPDGQLKPGAYADIIFETRVKKRLSVPSESILRSAEGDYVVVAKGEGRFQPQRVKTGIRSQGRTEILQGIKAGESILVSSQFFIDSESNLRESFRKLQRAQKPLSLLEINNDQLAMIDHLIDAALYLHKAKTQGFEAKVSQLKPAQELSKILLPDYRGTKLQFVLEEADQALIDVQLAVTDSKRLQAQAKLVAALRPWILEGKPEHYRSKGLKLIQDQGTGFHWLQLEKDTRNPYGDGKAVEIAISPSTKTEASVIAKPQGDAHAHH